MRQELAALAENFDAGLALLAVSACIWSYLMSASMLERAATLDSVRKNIWIGVAAVVAANGMWANFYLSALAAHAQIQAIVVAVDSILAGLVVHLSCLLAFILIINRRSRAADLAAAAILSGGVVLMQLVGLKSLGMDADLLMNPGGLAPSAGLIAATFVVSVFAFRTGGSSTRRFAWIVALGALATILNLAILGLSVSSGFGVGYRSAADFSSASLEGLAFIVTCVLTVGIGAAYATDRLLSERGAHVRELDRLVAQLRESEQKAQSANAAKSEFVTNISHEIRTPLTAVMGMLDLLNAPTASPDQRRQIMIAKTAANSLLTLVNDLIDMSRLEAGRIELQLGECDLAEVADEVIELLRPAIVEKPVDMRLFVDEDFPTNVTTDRARVRQILVNLVGNAVKFTESGKIAVRLKVKKRDVDRITAIIEVEDTGIGMEPEILTRLFERFSQADATIASRYGGAGLGLAISNKLAALLDGKIMVKSRPDVGSCFTVEFECAMKSVETHATSRPENFEALQRHVLIVDDNESIRYFTEKLLARFGMTAVSVNSGRAAIEAARNERFDVILMDVQMPEIDGLTAARRIRLLNPFGAETPIIALSAGALSNEREKCFASGMSLFVEKPIKPEALLAAIQKATRAGALVRDVGANGGQTNSVQEAAADRVQPQFSGLQCLDDAAVALLFDLFGYEKAAEMTDTMLTHAAELLHAARAALSNGDLVEAKRIAHGVRGMAGNWGATALAQEARRLEQEVEDLRAAEDALNKLFELIGKTREAFADSISSRARHEAKVDAA